MTTDEVRSLIYTYVRDHYSELAGTERKIIGRTPAAIPGEFTSFDVWVMSPYAGFHQDKKNPDFWSETIESALSAGEAFASTTSFEPTMAEEAWNKAVMAIIFALTIKTLYIWLRFAKFSSGLAVVFALLHDVLITLGAVSVAHYFTETTFGHALMLTDMKVNLPLVGAFLTLVGYSVNDTIVVFDRIRENRGKYGDLSIPIINNSINQTLSRTVLTSLTVFVAVVALYFFGGQTSSIHGLAFVMLFGTVVGTYSSIAIASPILVLSDYLKRLYVWSYPLIGVVLLAYYMFWWKTPAEFFGLWVGFVWVALQLVWLGLVFQATRSEVYGMEWKLLRKSDLLARLVALVSMLAPVATIFLFAVSVTLAKSVAAWAGPAALGALATCPATYFICHMVWHKAESAENQ
jgi:preprotein translocase SecF subunit